MSEQTQEPIETTSQSSPDRSKVREIVMNVKSGIRAKAELKRGGCLECREALCVLNGGS